MSTHKVHYDTTETEMAELVSNGEIQYGSGKKDSNIMKMIAHFKEDQKRKTVSIRIKQHSLSLIKNFARQQKIPYQTLINMQIDDFADSIQKIDTTN